MLLSHKRWPVQQAAAGAGPTATACSSMSGMPAVGELVHRPDGSVMVCPPQRCVNGHGLGPGRVLVGHPPCGCGRHGHTTWTCLRCDAVTYAPPIDGVCQLLAGAATAHS